jgi:probable F420-dependent oxidoreductase
MTVSVLLSNLEPRAALDVARATERAGLRRVWIADTPHGDPAAVGGAIASGTGLEVGTAVIGALSRTPAALATTVASWARLAGDGRPLHLGLGATGATIVAGWHGMPYARPVEALADTIAILRQALAGERTDHDGAVRRSHGFRLATGPVPEARLYIGGLGPRMRALAAAASDGLITSWTTPRGVRAAADDLARDAAAAGRARERLRLVARVYVDVDGDVRQARAAVSEELVQYVMSPPYARFFAEIGFAEEVREVTRAFARGDRAATAAAIGARMTDAFLLAGSADEVATRLSDFIDAGADELALQPLAAFRGGDPARTVRALGALLA